jgi:hypothetical protein
LIELDPLYVDVAIRRWEQITGVPAHHAESGLGFVDVAAKRGSSHRRPDASPRKTGGPRRLVKR